MSEQQGGNLSLREIREWLARVRQIDRKFGLDDTVKLFINLSDVVIDYGNYNQPNASVYEKELLMSASIAAGTAETYSATEDWTVPENKKAEIQVVRLRVHLAAATINVYGQVRIREAGASDGETTAFMAGSEAVAVAGDTNHVQVYPTGLLLLPNSRIRVWYRNASGGAVWIEAFVRMIVTDA